MERVRVVVYGCLLALGLLFCPSVAYASDGFLGGLEDLIGTRNVDVETDFERDYLESYEPSTRLESESNDTREVIEIEEGQEIQTVVNAANTLTWGTAGRTLYESLRLFIGAVPSSVSPRALFLLPAVGITFFWWGLRKSKNMIMNAFRKGKASV